LRSLKVALLWVSCSSYINSVYIGILFFCYVSFRNFAIIPWCKSLFWYHGVGDFSCERTNLLSLHQLHRRTLRVIKGAVRANLWSGIIELDCKSFWIHLLAHFLMFLCFSNCYYFFWTFKWTPCVVTDILYFPVFHLCADACYTNKIDK